MHQMIIHLNNIKVENNQNYENHINTIIFTKVMKHSDDISLYMTVFIIS